MRAPTSVQLARLVSSIGAGFALGLGCGSSVFGCEDDPNCSEGGLAGVCDPSGYCAFPDALCSSGLRYGAHAPAEIAGACVRDFGSTGDDAASDDTSATTVANLEGTSMSPEDSSTSMEDTSASAENSSMSAEDGSTSAGADEGLADSSSEDSGSDGGTATPPCEAGFWDDFDDDSLDRNWTTWALGSYDEPTQSDGRARVSLPATTDGWVGLGTDIGPMLGRAAGVEWTFDEFDQLAFAWFNVQSGTKYEFAVWADQLEIRMGVGDAMQGISSMPFDPVDHRFVRIRATDQLVMWESSSDGQRWATLHSAAHQGVGESHTLEFGIGTWEPLDTGAALDVQQAFRCP